MAHARCAAWESACVSRAGCASGLVVRRLLLRASLEPRVRGRTNPINKTARPSGGARRRGITPALPSIGVIIGATLENVLAFAGIDVRNGSCLRATRQLVHFLKPVVEAVRRIDGERDKLASGLACHRVLRSQRKAMSECRLPSRARGWLDRNGIADVAVGVTASVLVAHYVAANNGESATNLTLGLERCCANAEAMLMHWNTAASEHSHENIAVLHAEARARPSASGVRARGRGERFVRRL